MGVKYSITYGSQTAEITDADNNSFALDYVGVKSESISAGSGKTLPCKDKVMSGNLNVGTHSMACSGKVMRNDVVVSSQSYTPTVTLTITGSGTGGGEENVNLIINGVKYISAQTLTLPKGTELTIRVWGTWITNGWIQVNGTRVWSGTNGTYYVSLNQNMRADISCDKWHGTCNIYNV